VLPIESCGRGDCYHPGVDGALALREAILENLTTRKWRAGHRIPTERELSGQYGLSRSAVRRVLADMKEKRLITQTVGSGTYVSEQVVEALAAVANSAGRLPTSPAELMSARFVLEPAIVAMVIGNATSVDFARMHECCANGEAAKTLEQFEHWDGMLHEVIADAAHNSFISQVFRLMNQVRATGEWGALKRRSATPERRREYQQEHRALVAALQDRDGMRATELCLEHLAHVRRNLLGY
jgi:DNA-binding FadR family transcriptional regulator